KTQRSSAPIAQAGLLATLTAAVADQGEIFGFVQGKPDAPTAARGRGDGNRDGKSDGRYGRNVSQASGRRGPVARGGGEVQNPRGGDLPREGDMTQTGGVLAALALAVLAAAGCSAGSRRPATFAQAAREKADVTIVVTDSGLGGLSVVADLASRLPASGIVRSARIVFVNALLDAAIGYNDLRDEADKVRVFDAALEAMERRYAPDLVLVACNTLSVFYERTLHAKRGTTETVSIVPMGVDLVEKALRERPEARAVLFATKGTIDSGAHRRLLEQRGIAADRVVGQACPRLTGAIERGAHDAATASRIEGFVKEAVGRLGERSGPVVASLNCTHFGYARPLWERSFEALGFGDVTVL
ncbi:hypothetical protein ARNL5_03100, partial [Anaerolineae bacterium]